MNESCHVCSLECRTEANGHVTRYECPRCGTYEMTGSLVALFMKGTAKGSPALSYGIRRLCGLKNRTVPKLTTHLWESLVQNVSLPSPDEQAANILFLVSDHTEAVGDRITVHAPPHQALVGCATTESVGYLVGELVNSGLLHGKVYPRSGGDVGLTLKGWDSVRQLRNSTFRSSKRAFMAMPFGDEELDNVVHSTFKPAVLRAGFDLRRLDDEPEAGLIDDRLRVEIRRSRFLIADLSHGNRGAYWEAGFAEGVGLPVIYTCRRDVFNDIHFDTSHQLTVIWEPANLDKAGDELTVIIRATLPTEAQLGD